MRNVKMKIVAEYDKKKRNEFITTVVLRDDLGKWYVRVNGVITQKRLTASEIVRYLANSQHEE